MAELNIITWLWGSKYKARDVVRLWKACCANLSTPFQFHAIVENDISAGLPLQIKLHDIRDRHLMNRSCFCRLRMFDPYWQTRCGFNGTILALDLDLVIVANLDRYIRGAETFMILKGVNAVNPNPFNASIMRLKAGHHAEVWTAFTHQKASAVPYHEFPDDQGWIWHMMPNASGWKVGKESGIYGFQKPGWPPNDFALPNDARIIAFIGRRKPDMFSRLPWIKQHWTDAA